MIKKIKRIKDKNENNNKSNQENLRERTTEQLLFPEEQMMN
jgi:hypothetical protein